MQDSFKLLDKKDADKLIELLEQHYKDVKYYLNFSNPLELLVAAILSAQTKDTVVNSITPELFKRYKTIDDYANAKEEDLLQYIKRVSYAAKKAEYIINAAKIIKERYNSKIPDTLEDLTSIPGIGRKTANTILINAFGKVNGIPVDTWVIKLSYRMGLSKERNPEKIEKDLERMIDKKYWKNIAYVLKEHGKQICGIKPRCESCFLNEICPKNGVKKSD
ncbi:MAG: endonuclease III [Candidatus Micrarchaeota archaeon]|nr:MAG: endonuclease III [Candidatus Micrarchaeota archaeon]